MNSPNHRPIHEKTYNRLSQPFEQVRKSVNVNEHHPQLEGFTGCNEVLGGYSQHFIILVTYEWAQQASVCLSKNRVDVIWRV